MALAVTTFIREGANVAAIMGIGDMIAQFAIEKKSFKEWNVGRTARYSAVGLVVVGPTLRKWVLTLDKLVAKEQPVMKRGIKKMVIDQALFAPPFTLFLSYLIPFVGGEKHDTIVQRIKDEYITIMKRGYALWPASQVINFTFVPIQFQVIFVQIVAVIWNCYLSTKLNNQP